MCRPYGMAWAARPGGRALRASWSTEDGRPHGAAPTVETDRPYNQGRSPHPSRPAAVPPSPKGEGWSGAPHAKRLPPSRGKLSSEARLMRVPTGVMRLTSAPSSGPSGHLPPCGGKACGASRRPPLRRRKLHIPRFRLAAKARSFRCSSSPHATRFAGLARGPHIFSLQTGRRHP